MRGADVIIAAVGLAEVVRGDWVKPGATIVDVGINAVSMDVAAGSNTMKDGQDTVFRLPGTGDFRVVGDVAAGAHTRQRFSSS